MATRGRSRTFYSKTKQIQTSATLHSVRLGLHFGTKILFPNFHQSILSSLNKFSFVLYKNRITCAFVKICEHFSFGLGPPNVCHMARNGKSFLFAKKFFCFFSTLQRIRNFTNHFLTSLAVSSGWWKISLLTVAIR